MFFWNSLGFSRIQWMLAIWPLVPLPFLKPAWTSGSSWFMYCWSLAWRILSFTLLACAATAAKSLQSFPTLCDPIDGGPPGSPVPGILQARTLERVAISFSNAWKWKMKVKSLSQVRLVATTWTAAHEAPLSMGFFQARVIPLKDEKEKESWRQKQQQFIHTVCFTVRKIHSSRDVRQQFSGRTLYACSEGLNSKEKWRLNLLSQYLIECLLCARHSSKCSSYFNALNSHKKDLHDPGNNSDNHDGMITHLEPDILECKVKWALGSITTNKDSGGDGIAVELFQILKDDAVQVLHSICQQIWKTQQWP